MNPENHKNIFLMGTAILVGNQEMTFIFTVLCFVHLMSLNLVKKLNLIVFISDFNLYN